MFGHNKRYETYAGIRVEMDPETGMPLVRDGERWEVVELKRRGVLEHWPLLILLLDRDGRELGRAEDVGASPSGVRRAAVGIAANRIEDGERAANIARLVGTYPPKTLN